MRFVINMKHNIDGRIDISTFVLVRLYYVYRRQMFFVLNLSFCVPPIFLPFLVWYVSFVFWYVSFAFCLLHRYDYGLFCLKLDSYLYLKFCFKLHNPFYPFLSVRTNV